MLGEGYYRLNFSLKYALIFFIVVTGVIAYIPSFSVPFYLDDYTSIVNNNLIINGDVGDLFRHYRLRFITYYSFYLNHEISQNLDVTSFHIVNFLIHLTTSLVVYVFVRLLLSNFTEYSTYRIEVISLFCFALFLFHPLQTQAVTYIVQRAASLVALFYLCSLLSYFLYRIKSGWVSYLFLFLFVISTFFALLTKQNSFTLPLAIIVSEYIFFRKFSISKNYTLFIIILFLLFVFLYTNSELLIIIDEMTRETLDITRSDYIINQFVILWKYVYLFFFPLDLRLEHGVSVGDFSFYDFLLSFLVHGALISFAFVYKNKVIKFAVLMFYVMHLIESGIIPIRDLMFEHRTYLPNFTLILMFSLILNFVYDRIKIGYIKTLFLFLLTIYLFFSSVLTYNRNSLWGNSINFYKNELLYLPNNPRLNSNLATEYIRVGDFENAILHYEKSFKFSYQSNSIDPVVLSNYIAILIDNNDALDARKIAAEFMPKIKDKKVRAKIHANLSVSSLREGTLIDAISSAEDSLTENKGNLIAHQVLTIAYARQGDFNIALEYVDNGLHFHPNNPQLQNLKVEILKNLQ